MTSKAQPRSKLHQSLSGRTIASAYDSGHRLPTKQSSASRGQSFNGKSITPGSNLKQESTDGKVLSEQGQTRSNAPESIAFKDLQGSIQNI